MAVSQNFVTLKPKVSRLVIPKFSLMEVKRTVALPESTAESRRRFKEKLMFFEKTSGFAVKRIRC